MWWCDDFYVRYGGVYEFMVCDGVLWIDGVLQCVYGVLQCVLWCDCQVCDGQEVVVNHSQCQMRRLD